MRESNISRPFLYKKGFSLVELIITILLLSSLVILLLTATISAREYARESICATTLAQISKLMQIYSSDYNDWIVGSPNSSGNGANPGGARLAVNGGYYYPAEDADTKPALHIFDWASPLAMLSTPLPYDITQKYLEVHENIFICPSMNSTKLKVNINHSRITTKVLPPSYATSRFFLYVHTTKQTGTSASSLFYSADFVPEDYIPKLTHIENASYKAFLADACKIDRGRPPKISNWDYGLTTYGCWLNVDDPAVDQPSLSYRFLPAKRLAIRHKGGINILFFDGHVSWQQEADSNSNGGLGSGARSAVFWFPTGTNTALFPSHWQIINEDIIIP